MAEQEMMAGIETAVVECDPRELVLLEKNARYMKPETFRKLVENVKRDGVLTQLPFCVRDGERLKVLSGNHRVMAAIEAGLESVEVLVSKHELTPDRQRAIQLSHNAIVGEDDPLMLRALFDELGDVAWKAYSGLDDKVLDLMTKGATPPMGAQGLDVAFLTLAFLPGEKERMREALLEAADAGKDEAWLVPFALYDQTADMLDTTSLACEVRSMAVAFAHLVDVFGRHLGELKPEMAKNKGDFPLAVLFERSEVPRESARRVAKVLARYGDDPWEALETALARLEATPKKRARSIGSDASGVRPGEGGATPTRALHAKGVGG
ncbi:MAG: ParB-like nuclease domain-containing protein [Dehalococcoidia bacterium]|nr:ParB-like nuclease domain-containing protein [Dehalococcoidia bacterium]